MADRTSAIAAIGGTKVAVTVFRYAPPQARLVGGAAGGRWNPPNSFPALYFAGSRDSAIAEIYRRIINASDPPLPASGIILTLTEYFVEAEQILNLNDPDAFAQTGLTRAALTTGVGDYGACQEVAKIAHQCGYHGIIAPAASGTGSHLVLFEQQLEVAERPQPIGAEILNGIPPHPRRLRLVDDIEEGSA